MNEHKLWNLTREAWGALIPHFMPTFERFSAERGLDVPTWGLLLGQPAIVLAAEFLVHKIVYCFMPNGLLLVKLKFHI